MLFSIISLFAVAVPGFSPTISPASPATNVDPRSGSVTVTLTFAENVLPGTSGAGVIALSNSADVQLDPVQISGYTNTNPVTGSSVVINGKVVTITFKYSPIPEQTTFYVTATSDALQNAAGVYWNGLRSFTGTHDYQFTTGDFTAPTVLVAGSVPQFVPLTGSSAVAISQIYSVTFTENVQPGTGLIQTGDAVAKPGNIGLYKANGDVVELFDVTTATATTTPANGAVGIVGSTVYINPTLPGSPSAWELKKMYIRILNTALTDMSVNKNKFAGINDNSTWNFQLADLTPPTFAVTPANASTNVQQNAAMKMTFSDNRTAAGLTFALQKTGPLTALAVGDDVTSLVSFNVDPAGGVAFVPVTTFGTWKATYTAINEITFTFTGAYKFTTGAKYQVNVLGAALADVENNLVVSAPSVFTAGDFTAPTAAITYLQQGGYGVNPAPWLANSTATDKKTTKIFLGVTTNDVDPVSGLTTYPTSVKYLVTTSATVPTAAVVLATGTDLPLIATMNNMHQAVITVDQAGATLASNTLYNIYYVVSDNATVKNTSAVYTASITTNDIVAPTYTLAYMLGATAQDATAAVDKTTIIAVTFSENVASNTAGTLFTAGAASNFASTFTITQTNVTPNVTLVNGVDYTVTKVSDKVFEIIGNHSKWTGSASWMSKGNYSIAIDGTKIFDLAGSNPPYGTANAAASSTNLFTVKDYEGPTATFSPANGSTSVDNNGNVTITFSEAPYYLGAPVTQANVDALIELRKGDATTATTGSILEPRTVTIVGNVVTITPTNKPLSSQIFYRASVSTDITDVNGYKLDKYSDNLTMQVPASLEYSVFSTADNRAPLVTYTTYPGATVIPAVQDNVIRPTSGLVSVDNMAYPVILLDETVQEIAGNTPIASMDPNQIRSLITLKKGDVNGPNIEFTVLLAATNTHLNPPPTGMFEIVLQPIKYPMPYVYDNSGTYYFSIGGIQDAAKNPVMGSATFTVKNSTPLTLTASNPAAAATAVAKNGNLVLTFNQNVSKTTTSGSFITSVPAGLSIDVTNVAVTVSGNQVTIPYSAFTANTAYTINVPAGVFTAVANNAASAAIAVSFNTVDEFGPTIDFGTNVFPTAANSVSLSNGQLSLTFTENIVLGNGYLKIRKPEAGGATTVADINVQSSYVTIDGVNPMKVNITIPVSLVYNQAYFVEIPQTAFKDAAGNNFQWSDSHHAVALHTADVTAPAVIPNPYVLGTATWDFSTVVDAIPTFTTFVPAAGSNFVAANAGLTINFSEPVTLATTGNRALTIYKTIGNTQQEVIYLATAGLVWNSTTSVTIPHLPFSADTYYYVSIDPATFVDATGNPTAALGTNLASPWNFTTTDLTAPTAVLTTVSGAALTAVKLADGLILTFSEPVALTGANTWATALTLSTGSFAAVMDASKKVLTITPANPFASLTSASLSVNPGTIQDLATTPNAMAPVMFALTGEDKTAPVMTNTVLTPYAKDKVTFTATIDEKSTVYYLTTIGGSLTALPTVASVMASAQYSYTTPAVLKNIEITGLAEFTSYDVYVMAVDMFGNQTAVTKLTLHTTDATAPFITSLTPANGAVNVNYNHATPAFNGVDLKINFSEKVGFTANNAKLVVRRYDNNVEVFSADQTSGLVITSSTGTLMDVVKVNVPKALLTDKTQYYVEFEYNMVTDMNNGTIGAANNVFATDFIGKANWSFTTADETAPVLMATAPATTTVPAFGAVNVPVAAPGTLTLRFSEPIAIGTGTVYIYRIGSASPQEVIQIPSTDVMINPSNNMELLINRHNTFASEVSYYVSFPATGVTDLAPVPNYFAGIPASTWIFTTADITSPAVAWSVANNATAVPTATVVSANFVNPRQTELTGITVHEPLYNSGALLANGDIKGWFTVTANGTPVALTSALYNGAAPATVTFAVTGGLLSNTTYVFSLNAPATLTDQVGNAVPSSSVTFTTVDNSSPMITFTPATTTTNVPVGSYVDVKFNKTIYNNNMLLFGTSPNANFTPTAADFATGNYVTFTDAALNPVAFTTQVVTPGMEYRLIPSAPLASTTTYNVIWVANRGSVQEVYDRLALPTENKLDQTLVQRTTTFTTEDVVAPTLLGLEPANNPAGIVNPGQAMVMTFSEKVMAGTGNIVIRRGNGQIFAEISPADITYSTVSPWTATIAHPAFEKFTSYYVIIPNGAITDVSTNANKFAGFADNTFWSFKTDDGTAPFVLNYTPANGSNNIPVFSSLTMQMSENIQLNAGNVVIYYKDFVDPITGDGNAIEIIPITSSRVVISGSNIAQGLTSDVITIDPATTFDKLGTFYIRIDNGIVKDFAATPNNYAGISNNTTWAFTVTDNTKPALVSTLPVNNATGLGSLPTYTMNFDRNVMAGLGNIKVMNYDYNPLTFAYEEKLIESIPVTSSQVVISGMVVTVTPTIALADNKVYYILVDNTAITNTASSKDPWAGISSPFIWRFTTADNTPPTVVANPATGTAMLNTFDVTLTFSEAVTGVDATSVTVTGGTVVLSTVTAGTVYKATVTAADYATVVLSLSNVIKDLAGNAFVAQNYTYTIGDNTPPTLVATPGAGILTQNVFTVNLDFNKEVTGVAAAVTVDNGATVTVTGSGKSYVASIKAKANSTVNLTVSNAVKDLALHSFAGAVFAYTTGDNTPPVVTITGPASPIPTSFLVTFTFDKEVTGFKDGLTVDNGTIEQVAGSGKVYVVSIKAAEKAAVTITLATTIKDLLGNAFAGKAVTYTVGDFTPPTLIVTPPASPVATLFTVDLLFNKPVTGVLNGITVVGGKLVSVAGILSSGGTEYTVTVSALEQTTVNIVISDAITDITPSTNKFAGQTLTYTTGDFTKPELVSFSPNAKLADNYPVFKMTFTENVMMGAGGSLKVYKINSTTAILDIPITADMISGKDVVVSYTLAQNQSGLDKNTRYYVLVDGTALTDMSGNAFIGVSNQATWTFLTGSVFATGVAPTVNSSLEFKVYPNPFVDFVNVDNASMLSKLVVTNIAGQVVKEVVNPTQTIQLNELRSGIYFISMYNMDNVIAQTAKIVKR